MSCDCLESKPGSVIDRNVKQGRLRRTAAMKMSQQPEAFSQLHVVHGYAIERGCIDLNNLEAAGGP